MATVIPFEELRVSPTAALFQGGELGVSIFVTNYAERGRGRQLHKHPYAEIFVVHAGTALFMIAPPDTPHRFECPGDDTLRTVSVHTSGTLQQTDL